MSGRYYVPRFSIRVAGLLLAADITNQVTRLTYENNLDLADMFSLVMRNADNRLLDSPLFDLGKTVEIYMGYGDDLQPMMLGEITAIEPSFPENGPPTLTVSGYDKSYRMRHNQPDPTTFRYMNTSAIAALIAVENMLIPIVDPSPVFHTKIIQTGSDMAFLKELARKTFFDVYVHWDNLYFRFPRPQTEAYVLEWGKNLSSFSPRLSSAGMAGLQIIRGYNEELAQTVIGLAMAPMANMDNIIEKLGSSAFDLLVGLGRRVIRNQSVESPLDATLLAKSMLQELLEGLYEGSGSCIGIPELRADRFISIEGVGQRFSGKYRLRKVTHTIDDSGYHTSFEVTQRSHSSLLGLLRKSISEIPSPNQKEKFYGVAVGKVINNIDFEGARGRVQLSLPWLSDFCDSDWARVATPMAGSDKGMFFLPDIGDEVLVAFDHGNLSKPVVLGGLWNGLQRPPVTHLDGLNRTRMIKTGTGHTITFDDPPLPFLGKMSIQSGGGHTITLDDTSHMGKITIQSSGGHTITLDDTGVGKISLQDKGGSEITMNGDGSVTINAKSNVAIIGGTSVVIESGTMGAARLGDTVGPTLDMKAWIEAVSGVTGQTTPNTFGQITDGSATVKIG